MTITLPRRPAFTAVAGTSVRELLRPRRQFRGWLALGAVFTIGAVVEQSGWRSALVIAVFLAAAVAVMVMWRRARSLLGALVSTAVWGVVTMVAGLSRSLVAMSGSGYLAYGAYLFGLLAVTVVVLRSRRPSHRPGLTIAVAHAALMSTLPLQMFVGAKAAAPLLGLAFAFVVVWFRLRSHDRAPLPDGKLPRRCMIGRQIVSGVLAVSILVLATVTAGGGTASALWPFSEVGNMVDEAICSITKPSLGQQDVGAGPEAWFSNRNLAEAPAKPGSTDPPPEYAKDVHLGNEADMTQFTLYEIAGLRGLDWVPWQYSPDSDGDSPDQCSMSAWMWSMVGNLIFTINLYLLQATIALKELAQSSNPALFLYDATDSIVAHIYVHFVVPTMAIALIFGALMLGFSASRGGGREQLGKVGASMGVMVLAGFMFGGLSLTDSGPSMEHPEGSGFYTVASTLDETVTAVNNALSAGIFSMINRNDEQAFCHVPTGTDKNLGQRLSSCALAETLAYEPWAIGQFGPQAKDMIEVNSDQSSNTAGVRYEDDAATAGDGLPCYTNLDMCRDLRSYLIVQQGGPAISNMINQCMGDGDFDRKKADQCIPWYAVGTQLADKVEVATNPDSDTTAVIKGDPVTMFSAFTGANGLQRVTQAASALAATGVTALGILPLSIITMVWHFALFGLFLLGAIVLLLATFSGKSAMAKTWVLTVVHTFGARFVYGLVMSLMIFIICAVFRMDSIYTGMKILIIAMVLFGLWKSIGKIDEKIRINGSNAPNVGAHAQQGVRHTRDYARRGARGGRRAVRPAAATARTGAAGAKRAAAGTAAVAAGGGRAAKGTGVGTVNALGGKHKANVQAARESGHGKLRVGARRAVTGTVTGSAGAVKGAYQGARGNAPRYTRGTNRAVDNTRTGTKEAMFKTHFKALQVKESINDRANLSHRSSANRVRDQRRANESARVASAKKKTGKRG